MSLPADALVLTAGLGTRLQPLTFVRAKPAIPVAGEPMIRRIIRWLASSGVTRVTLNLHHLPETIASVVGDGADLGAHVRYSWEQPHVLGTAGGPRQALDIIGAETFFLINGDTLTDVKLDALADAHATNGAMVTLAVTPNTAPTRYGGVLLSPSGVVTGVVPRGDAARGSFHVLGVQIANRDAFASVIRGQAANSIGDVYETLTRVRPGAVQGFVTAAEFWDVGTIGDYWTTSSAFARIATETDARHAASVGGSIVWNDVEIGEGAVLDECIVTDHVRVPPGARYRRSVLVQPRGGPLTVTPFETSR